METSVPEPFHMGHDDPRLCRHRLHGVSTQVEANIDGRLIPSDGVYLSTDEERGPAYASTRYPPTDSVAPTTWKLGFPTIAEPTFGDSRRAWQ